MAGHVHNGMDLPTEKDVEKVDFVQPDGKLPVRHLTGTQRSSDSN